jgi:ribonuclease PH
MSDRSYNRGVLDCRPIEIQRGFTEVSPGSVLVSYGKTKVLVTASVEERVPRHLVGLENHGWLTAEYALLPGSTGARNQRERQKVGGRTAEIQRIIGRSLRSAIDLTALGQRTITIDADVIQADGGTRVAAITGGYVALMDALRTIEASEKVNPSPKAKKPWVMPVVSPVAAVSVGMVNGRVVVDLDYDEDSQASVDANVVMNARGEFIEVQLTSEGVPFSRAQLDEMVAAASGSIEGIMRLQTEALARPLPGASVVNAG